MAQWGAALGFVFQTQRWGLVEARCRIKMGMPVCSEDDPEKAALFKCVVLPPYIVCNISKAFFLFTEGENIVRDTGLACNENRTVAGGSGYRVWFCSLCT